MANLTSGNDLSGTQTSGPNTSSPHIGDTGAYGTYQGRSLSRSEYEQLPEADRMRVELVAEQLHVETSLRQAGEVEITKRVVEEQVLIPVTLRREEVVVTRREVNQPAEPATAGTLGTLFQDETIRVLLHREVAQVTKSVQVVEEIEIEKRAVSQQQTVSDTLRREEIDVQAGSGLSVQSTNAGTTGASGAISS